MKHLNRGTERQIERQLIANLLDEVAAEAIVEQMEADREWQLREDALHEEYMMMDYDYDEDHPPS